MYNAKDTDKLIKVEIPKHLAIEEAGKLRDELYEHIAKGNNNFMLDFKNCEFIDSTGLGVMVAAYKKCVEQGGTIKLRSVHGNIMKIFTLTRLDQVFEIL